ncbi:MAG: glutamine--fructose-6-phosphate transaminase (isomerizing), partial [Patescibacteria group bacterium]
MCGIFGYVGTRTDAPSLVLSGLKKLDYRGYDSWGVSYQTPSGITTHKSTSILTGIEGAGLPQSRLAIAHTRWATTGSGSIKKAHPHASSDNRFTLAQNGIVENHLELKRELEDLGYKFISETDTEVIVRLIEHELT